MDWNNMSYGVPDFHTPCVIKLKKGKHLMLLRHLSYLTTKGFGSLTMMFTM